MTKYYSEMLARFGNQDEKDHGRDALTFESVVLRRYSEVEGPWVLHKDDVTFYHWLEEEPIRGLILPFSESKNSVTVQLKALASLSKSEQEHWKKFQR